MSTEEIPESVVDALARKMHAAGIEWNRLHHPKNVDSPPFDGEWAEGWRFIARSIIQDK